MATNNVINIFTDDSKSSCLLNNCLGETLEDVPSFENTCHLFDFDDNEGRQNSAGTACNATIKLYNNQLDLSISSVLNNKISKIIPLADWKLVFQNANCHILTIETDGNLPVELLDQVLCCDSIGDIKYYGPYLEEHVLNKLSMVALNHVEAKVQCWKAGMAGTTKLTLLDITDHVDDLYDLVEVMKFVPDVNIRMTCNAFRDSAHSVFDLRNMHCIPDWQFIIDQLENKDDADFLFSVFEKMIYELFGEDVYCEMDFDPENNHLFMTVLSDSY
ncbi:unnamed protein product [Caenorhabditis angaria]|uniref:Uncharacterized protein n=1 Tax=Caenorhabditis angaria TaxID=860376 RepID=A0A9P1NBY6_9PELO|nr:unnamed protein product [Caenorhabditis angaria]